MNMKRREMVRICRMYYEENMTQQQIAKKMDFSRMKISRLLQRAKEEGIVQILIDCSGIYPELEKIILDKYNLKEVMVVETMSMASSKEEVASAAAYFLDSHLQDGAVLAVGWGTTIKYIPQNMTLTGMKDILFVPMIGGHGQSELEMHASTIAASFAKQIGGRALSLIAPAFVENKEEKAILLRNEQIEQVLKQARDAKYAIFSLGNPLAPNNSIGKSGYISDKDRKQLEEKKVICDVVSTVFLDNAGEERCKNITDRCIALSGQELKNIPNKICIAQGREKTEAVRVALKAGFADILIIDKTIAENIV